jgi:hypothetical protein
MSTTTFDVTQLPALYAPDPARLALARRRQAAVYRGERPDAWPLLLWGGLTPAQEAIPAPNFAEAFSDADLMLCGQVRGACALANAGADGVPSIRVNFGTGTLLACVGLEQQIFPDKMPWLKEHLSKEAIARLTPDDLQPRGTFARGLEVIARFKEIMGDRLAIYCMDTQGPLDLAHLMMGDDLFYVLYDDPDFAHHLLELSLELGIRAHTWMKEASGEPLAQHHHSGSLYAENMGVRICEDTTAILSPNLIDEFAIPYTRRLAQHFGGAWVHYCGRNDYLTRAVLAIPEIRALNFGHIPGHEFDHPFAQDMAWIATAGKVYTGDWPRFPEESGADYLRRLHGWASQGCLIPNANAACGENGFADIEAVKAFWYEL